MSNHSRPIVLGAADRVELNGCNVRRRAGRTESASPRRAAHGRRDVRGRGGAVTGYTVVQISRTPTALCREGSPACTTSPAGPPATDHAGTRAQVVARTLKPPGRRADALEHPRDGPPRRRVAHHGSPDLEAHACNRTGSRPSSSAPIPAAEAKIHDVVGLYLNPPTNGVVLSVDEKTQIQALDRTQPILPLRSDLPARQTHDYVRHGPTSLYAALEVASGPVHRRVQRAPHGCRLPALPQGPSRVLPRRELHVILDNSSTHKTPEVRAWLAAHPRVHFHFTPTGASWLNMVEAWFSI